MIKIIKDFNINTDTIPSVGAFVNFIITGDEGAKFRLSANIRATEQYYSFVKKEWVLGPSYLNGEIKNINGFSGAFDFPSTTTAYDIDIFLLADASNTEHAAYVEVLKQDGSIDVNNSSGSDSLMLIKHIVQVVPSTLTISPTSKSTATGFAGATLSSDTISSSTGSYGSKIPFTLTATAVPGLALRLEQQPDELDFYVKKTRAINDPVIINGEDPFDNGQTARSTGKVVDGAVSTANVTMDDDVSTLWAVGDRVTGNAALDAKTGVNAVTITAINVSENPKVFTMSEVVAIDDDETLDFTEPYYHRWGVVNTVDLSEGATLFDTQATAGSFVSPYRRFTTIFEGTDQEQDLVTVELPAITDSSGVYVYTYEGRVPSITTTGQVIFNKAQRKALTNETVDFLTYGRDAIRNNSKYDIEISDVKAVITKPFTTTTAAVVNSTSVPVALGHGVMTNYSLVDSVNISTGAAVRVTGVSSYSSGSPTTATLTLSSAQTLENGETLTFDNAARLITITGNIKIKEALGDLTLFLDLDNFIIGTSETT